MQAKNDNLRNYQDDDTNDGNSIMNPKTPFFGLINPEKINR
jgi:hypothetical protein